MLFLSEKDILKSVTFNEVMDTVEAAMILYEKQEFLMPPRTQIDYRENTLLLMPCFLKEIFGTKLVTIFPDNKSKNAPVTDGVLILNHAETGMPLALLNGRVLTAIRTGGVGGVSIRHLAPIDVKRIGLTGAGIQGLYQSFFACTARKVTDLYIYDIMPEMADRFEEKFSMLFPDVRLHKVSCTTELLESSEVVITATQSLEPVLPNEGQLLKGKHYVGIGSFKPSMREYPEEMFKLLEQVFIDTEHGIHESGDLCVPIENGWIERNQIQTLYRLFSDNKMKTEVQNSTTFFKSVGMGLFDIAVSELVFKNASLKGLGQEIDL